MSDTPRGFRPDTLEEMEAAYRENRRKYLGMWQRDAAGKGAPPIEVVVAQELLSCGQDLPCRTQNTCIAVIERFLRPYA